MKENKTNISKKNKTKMNTLDTVLEPSENLVENTHFEGAFKRIYQMYVDRKLCDVTLLCNDKQIEIRAHRIILSSVSDYFSAMFTNNLAETFQDQIEISADGEALKLIIEFIYTGKLI